MLSLNVAFAQEQVEMSIEPGVENPELQMLMDFENIGYSELQFEGSPLKDNFYVLRIKEFQDGEMISSSVLFDETGNDYFKIDSTYTTFRFLSKIDQEELKLWIRGNRFGSKQSFFELNPTNGRYVVKDFLGRERTLKVPTDDPFYIFAIITPNRNADGSKSYCKVAQSEIEPELFGQEFNIPHYFLIEMEFIDGTGVVQR